MDSKASALRVGGWKSDFFLFSHLEYNKWEKKKQNWHLPAAWTTRPTVAVILLYLSAISFWIGTK